MMATLMDTDSSQHTRENDVAMVALKEVAENTLHTAETCDGRKDLLRKPSAVKRATMTG
jgi:hypothetical protein